MIKGIGKILGEFLRPIADVIMILLAPILALLRPLLITLRTLMAPFKQAAMVAVAAGQKLITQGMGLGADTKEGAALISEGFAGSFAGASLMFSGFVEALFTPLAEAIGFGDQFKEAMDNWQGSALEGVHRVIILSNSVDNLSGQLGNLREGVESALSVIDEQVYLLKEEVDTFTIENFKTDMETAQAIINATALLASGDFELAKEALSPLNLEFNTFVGSMHELKDDFPGFNEELSKMVKLMNKVEKEEVLGGVRLSTELDKPSGWKALEGGIQNMVQEVDWMNVIFPGKIVDDFKSGWNGVYADWEKNTEKSLTSFQDYGDSLQSIAKSAEKSAAAAASAARSSKRSARKAEANSSSIFALI